MKQSKDVVLSIDDYINTIENISNKLKEKEEITLCEYNLYNQIKREAEDMKDDMYESSNQQKYNFELQLNKLRTILEIMKSSIDNKKEYEFISNYFVDENNLSSNLESSLSTNDTTGQDNLSPMNNRPAITDEYLTKLDSIEFESFKSLGDALKLTSSVFLSGKAKFTDDIIAKVKTNCEFDNAQKPKVSSEHLNILKKKSDKKILPHLNKSNKPTSDLSDPNQNDKIEREIEEEINNQIFKYTRNMKENAKAFNSKLKQDNKTLSSIEDIQTIDKDKTEKETKRLKEFNYTLSIGFIRLIMMFALVIVTFIFSLLIMRIFPKFA